MFGQNTFGSTALGAGADDGGGITSSFIYVVPPMATANSEGHPTTVIACTAPRPTAKAFGGGSSSLSATAPTTSSVGHDSTGENAFAYTAPSPTLKAYGGANTRLTAPRPTLTTNGTVTALATADLTAPRPTLAASGTVSGMAGANLTAPSPNLIGYGGAVVSITLTGKPTVQATGTTGGVSSASITAPLFELTASGTAQNYGSVDIIAPSARLGAQIQAWLVAPSATLTAIGSAVVTATYEAYAVNLNHAPRKNNEAVTDEVTHYTNFPFTHIVRYKNSYFGANTTGLYLLEGTTDDGVPIPWEFETALTDANTPQMKTVEMAYFGGRMGPEATITLHVGEKNALAYNYTTPRGASAQNYRQAFGRGAKARYYALAATSTGELELDSITFNIATMARRI